MTTAQQAAYESFATMRRAQVNIQVEMNEFALAAAHPQDHDGMERARRAAQAYLDAYFDAAYAAARATGGK